MDKTIRIASKEYQFIKKLAGKERRTLKAIITCMAQHYWELNKKREV